MCLHFLLLPQLTLDKPFDFFFLGLDSVESRTTRDWSPRCLLGFQDLPSSCLHVYPHLPLVTSFFCSKSLKSTRSLASEPLSTLGSALYRAHPLAQCLAISRPSSVNSQADQSLPAHSQPGDQGLALSTAGEAFDSFYSRKAKSQNLGC